MYFCNITILHSPTPYDILGEIVQIKTVNYYTHIITLPTTLKQVLLLPDPVFWKNSKELEYAWYLMINRKQRHQIYVN